MGLRELTIKSEYRSFIDDVVKDFYIPLLSEAVLYQRAVGFFSSSALSMISRGIDGLIKNGGKIQIVASPRLTEEDYIEIQKGYELRKVIENSLSRELKDPENEEDRKNLSLIAQLVSQGILDIKIAFLTTNNEVSMYHEKMGIITDANGDSVAFSGSMNESENAFRGNYESFDAFCSWTSDAERVFQKEMAFKAIWEDYEPGIEIYEFPEAVKQRLYEYNPTLADKLNIKATKSKKDKSTADEKLPIHLPDDFRIRSYQSQALEKWRENGFRGIYDMATGTGKTLTALASIEYLYRFNNNRLAIIIVCPYQHLVEQWCEDIVRFGIRPIIGFSASPQKKWKKHLEQAVRSFNLGVLDYFCFVTTNASFVTKSVQQQIQLLANDTVLVVDEAHNMGAQTYRRYLPSGIPFRLALSATIDRHNDEEGTEALKCYFGEKCIEYSLRDAIDNRMLTRYYYHPVLTYLEEDELEDYLSITHQLAKAIKKRNGKVVFSEYAKQLLIKRARIVAGARGKLSELEKQIQPYKKDNHLLIYCGATTIKEGDVEELSFGTRQIDIVTNLLGNKMQMRVGRFTSQETAQERAQIKKEFAKGDMLQALVAIKCLDEGVNIPSIKTAFILASSTNPKEYIQRRGRVLRKFPGKEYAIIFDFITLPFSADTISSHSPDVVSSSKGLVKRELIRMLDFAEISENPSETYNLIYELKHGFGITEEDLKEEEEQSSVV